jgi:hypothetical protein
LTLGKKASAKVINQSEYFVAFAFATGQHFRLLTAPRPGMSQRPPLRKTGFIAKEQQCPLLPCEPQGLGPRITAPRAFFGFIQVIGNKTRFLLREPQIP